MDPRAVQRWEQMPAPEVPWLHEEVGRRMEERLQWIRLQPSAWLHWDPLRGGRAVQALLEARYPSSECHVYSPQPAALAHLEMQWRRTWWARLARRGTPLRYGLPEPASVDMVWANMCLHRSVDPQTLMEGWLRALRVDGFLMFSCLGPDTAREMRAVYEDMGWGPMGHELTDMHDWGDMLVQAGFAEPVMDMERVLLTYDSPEKLLGDLRSLGRNFHVRRQAATKGRNWYRQLCKVLVDRLAKPEEDGRLGLTFELIYGHALKPAPRVRLEAETRLSLDQMREALRQHNRV